MSTLEVKAIQAPTGYDLDMPAGHILQIVQDTHGAEQNSTSTTFADTGLTATITPKFASSKILICVQHTGCAKYGGSSNNNGLSVSLLRGSSIIAKISDYSINII